ncbi:hypothetical protein BU24DRAFT_61421 [Aaosphaeria arxii CBS 175.79]|uniref:Uncharacterized protein n=1 Tax=Aaosphaeria arxii CBS 175.79 TaxID=1450172 RepID=A0A6A5XCA0_9PLEO|nr:uncharacterized protein BU24DRAFT_61421 [Aaosphaeria arxii CBS 175.79]KAF2010598.1 hypothetical protein BU24DRAFT_61421 [Aaosphaeria arxii CBS 175.79]
MLMAKQSLFSKSALADIAKLSSKQKCSIINTFWPHLNLSSEAYKDTSYAGFLRYLGRNLQYLHQYSSKLVVQDWDDLSAMCEHLRTHRTSKRALLLESIQRQYINTPESHVGASIDLAARLLLGLNISGIGMPIRRSNTRDSQVHWHDNQSLDEMIMAEFPTGTKQLAVSTLAIDTSFTAVTLKSVCRVNIRWTDNLVDHLKLHGRRGDRTLSIYQHKICLVNHLKGPESSILPEDLLRETLTTLSILFPVGDEDTEAFLQDQNIQFWNDYSARESGFRGLDDFKYWKHRLTQLLTLYHGPPETVIQTLLDTRNVSQFATLWVAIFGVFFLTILFGVLSTIYSVKQYNVAVKSYELAIAQACQQNSAPLVGFCD